MGNDRDDETSISARGVGEQVRYRDHHTAHQACGAHCYLQQSRRASTLRLHSDLIDADLLARRQVLEFFWNLASLNEVCHHTKGDIAVSTWFDRTATTNTHAIAAKTFARLYGLYTSEVQRHGLPVLRALGEGFGVSVRQLYASLQAARSKAARGLVAELSKLQTEHASADKPKKASQQKHSPSLVS